MKSSLTFFLVLFTLSGLFAQTECTVKIVYSMNKSLPPSYTFKIDPQTEGAKYGWLFGDNTISDSPSPTHTYKMTDTYVVKVKATSTDGKVCYGEIKGRFEGDTVITPPVSTILTGKGKVKNMETATCGMVIILDNGTVLVPVEIVPNFIIKDGQYVELAYELLNDKPSGCSAGISAKIHKIAEIIQPSVCRIPVTFRKNNTTPESYTFITDAQPDGSKYYWYFGDGGMSELTSPTYVYKKTNAYLINLKVVDLAGKVCYGELKETFVGETNPECKAYFTATNKLWSDPAMMKKMVFANLSIGDIRECMWNFGDNTTSADLKPTHEYAAFGEYKVCLTISTVAGCRSEYCAAVKVEDIIVFTGCKFDLVVKPKPETPNAFLFYAVCPVEIKTYSWNFGDGKTSDAKNPEHVYEKTGFYEVTCILTTQAGCTETRTIKHNVMAAPLPNCTGAINLLLYDPTDNMCNGKATVKLLDETGAEIREVKYTWSDGRTGSTVENLCPDKPYTVQAVIDNVCQKNTSFTLLSKPIWRASTINGQNNFTVISPKEGVNYEWNFGDGKVITGADVSYDFEKDGVYNVTLKAVIGGDFSEYSQQVVVLNSITGIDIINKSELEIFPNPVKEMLRINFGNPVQGKLLIEIINITGQLTYTQLVNNEGFSHASVNVQHLKSGIYFLRISDSQRLITNRKFIKAD